MKIIVTESQYNEIKKTIKEDSIFNKLMKLAFSDVEDEEESPTTDDTDIEDSTEEEDTYDEAPDSSVVKQNKIDISKFNVDLANSPQHHQKYRPKGNWESDNAWDLFAPVGTKVYSFSKGKVSAKKDYGIQPSGVYGIGIIVKGEGKYPNFFYTHVKNVKLNVGDKVNVGDYIGEVMEMPNAPSSSHVHVGIERGKHLRDFIA